MRSIVLCTIWLQRNQVVYHNTRWPVEFLECKLWDAVIYLARASYAKIQWCEQHQLDGIPKAEESFDTL